MVIFHAGQAKILDRGWGDGGQLIAKCFTQNMVTVTRF